MYATVDDVINRYGKECFAIAGKTEGGEIDSPAIARALEEATSEMDTALQSRYTLPLDPIPPVLRRLCVDLAVGALPRNGATEATVYERRAKEARALLTSLAKGETTLGLAPAPAHNAGGGMAYAGPSSDFRTKLDEYI